MPNVGDLNLVCGYCTNVHPGRTLAQVQQQLDEHAVAVQRQHRPARPLPVGLWFAADVVDELGQAGAIEAFGQWLAERKLRPYTLNGFPFGNFHQPVVKHTVYEPDWTTDARLDYTSRLAELLAKLIGEGDQGSISTLPIGWPAGGHRAGGHRAGGPGPGAEGADWGAEPSAGHVARLDAAAGRLRTLAEQLRQLEDRTGRCIHVNLEPEPGCLLDTAGDVVRFFEEHLLLRSRAEPTLRRYLGVCHDVCHAAVMFEPQAQAIKRYRSAGIRVGKVQVSSAVVAPFDQLDGPQARAALAQLQRFDEPRYLHQTTVRSADGAAAMYDDLPLALAALGDDRPQQAWRVHFHVPIYVECFDALQTSQPDIARCLAVIAAISADDDAHATRHVEVETYAWPVLPAELRTPTLAQGIARELAWLVDLPLDPDATGETR